MRQYAWLACALVLSAGCAQPGPDGTITKRDFSGNDPFDMGVEDLTGADLTGGGFDMAGDMIRAVWTDHSFDTGPNPDTDIIRNRLWGVWSNNAGLVFIVGDQSKLVKSTNGNTFAFDTSMKPATVSDLIGITTFGAGPTAAPMYITGTGGQIWSYAGGALATGAGTWTAENLSGSTASINQVWVAPNGDAYAVGGSGFAMKKIGAASWTTMGTLDGSAYNMWGYKTAGGVVLYAVGFKSTGPNTGFSRIWKSTGNDWIMETAPTNNALYGVWGATDTDVYAVGDGGTILHSNGGGVWTAQPSPVSVPLEAVSGANATEVYAVGDNGTVLHKFGIGTNVWEKEVLADPAENRNLLGVWASPTEVWVVGGATTGKPTAAILKK